MIGDWVAVQTNGLLPTDKASSVVVFHKDDDGKTHSIFPRGDLGLAGMSWAPPKPGADPQNSVLCSADMGIKKVAGITIDPAKGDLSTAFVLDNITSTFQPVFGPADKRMLVLTNVKLPVAIEPIPIALKTSGNTEPVTRRDAATGKLLAEPDFFEPLSLNSLTPPGFGGRVCFPKAEGEGFHVLQPMPAAAR